MPVGELGEAPVATVADEARRRDKAGSSSASRRRADVMSWGRAGSTRQAKGRPRMSTIGRTAPAVRVEQVRDLVPLGVGDVDDRAHVPQSRT
jgi:hypothetical protein